MNILIVEDHRLVADALQIMLKEIEPGANITACYSTQHALSTVDGGRDLDLIITDLFMPGIDGIGLLAGLRNREVNTPVVIVTGATEEKYIVAAVKNGAAGFIQKTLPGAEMMAGLKKVLSGGRFFPDNYRNLLGSPNQISTAQTQIQDSQVNLKGGNGGAEVHNVLGEKQLQVLSLMREGNSNKQISQIIGVSEATIKYHTSHLFKLLAVKNRTACVRKAQEIGWLEA